MRQFALNFGSDSKDKGFMIKHFGIDTFFLITQFTLWESETPSSSLCDEKESFLKNCPHKGVYQIKVG